MPSQTFNFEDGWQVYTVPDGVDHFTVEVKGAGSNGTRGGRVTGRINAKEGTKFYIRIGEAGKPRDGSQGGAGATGGGGRGGDGQNSQGGYGGGGASHIRQGSTSGTVRAVAGGAGGTSGGGLAGGAGSGGQGGSTTGENGFADDDGTTATGNATGGTQTQPGNRGTSGLGSGFDGHDAGAGTLAIGGAGGQSSLANTRGGGGGGGGWRAGGGGQAGQVGVAPAGGGAGGSNYVGGLSGSTNERGQGATGNGQVVVTWTNPEVKNDPPSTPSEVKVNGKNESAGMATKSTGRIEITAKVDDPNKGQLVRLLIFTSRSKNFSSFTTRRSDFAPQGSRATVVFPDLDQNTQYYMRVYAEDDRGKRSNTYNAVSFWTNRAPLAPELTAPSENFNLDPLSSAVFDWDYKDPDPNDEQQAYQIRWRRSATINDPASPWTTFERTTTFTSHTEDPGVFRENTFYDWQVRTRNRGLWGPWALARSFYVTGTSRPPKLIYPVDGQAVPVDVAVEFAWQFRDPDPGDAQTKADLRYRVVGTDDWTVVVGDTTIPGAEGRWTIPQDRFSPGFHYEWQVQTTDTVGGLPSDWSDSETFWSTLTPGSGDQLVIPALTESFTGLGCGHNRVFVYFQGGRTYLGEITPLTSVQWGRQRDEISSCNLVINNFTSDCGALLAGLQPYIHELVVFRDGERVWEGPIIRITYKVGQVEVEASDVMEYVYRRIMRQGYNDAFRLVNGEETGLKTVVERATLTTMNALAPYDPNVLPYLTPLVNEGDARQSRSVPDYSRTAYEDIDDLAATAGLDYTVVGRRIIYNDTHRPIGRLPEMRDGDFSDPPIVSVYGRRLANYYAVTNNNGVWGAAYPRGKDQSNFADPYGPIELLSSAYGETAGGGDVGTLTAAQTQKLRETLTQQAKRNIASRYPAPIQVRVPDNSTLSPKVGVGINQLVPGVWIPLRATGTLREVTQWQKLDSVTVTESGETPEKVSVVMSPAPNQGEDPDAEQATEDT